MKAVFLCGGKGKRMCPIAEDKFLLDFLGKTLLQHQLEMAREAGLKRFVVIGNPANIEKIEKITKRISGIQVEITIQEKPLGIADALKSARGFLQGKFLVVNPNDVFDDLAYSRILSAAEMNSASSCMLGYHVEDYFPGGYLDVDSRGNLKHIVEKPEPGEEPGDLVNILVHFHDDPGRLLEYIDAVETDRDDVYECALDNMAMDGHKIKVIPYANFWAPIKYPWHIFKVVEHLLDAASSYISPTARISEKASLEGKVILADSVKVLENAVLRGPVYVGSNSIIGNNVLVRDHSHIGSNCVVGYCTEIKHSYIGNNCWFHSNYIGDSIIDAGCSFGSGAITANFRLDEDNIHTKVNGSEIDTGYDKLGAIMGKNCRVGINASLMPGVKVGTDSFVGPQVCLEENLEANKVIMLKTQYQVTDNATELNQDKRGELLKKLED